VVDLSLGWDLGRWAVAVRLDNLFDVAWNEAQFATTSRLRGEARPGTELHFTPGTPRRVELGVRWRPDRRR
jgi:hypothetical protein